MANGTIRVTKYIPRGTIRNDYRISPRGFQSEQQSLDLQLDALNKHGFDEIYEEKASGGKDDRPEFGGVALKNLPQRAIRYLMSCTSLTVWRVRRLS